MDNRGKAIFSFMFDDDSDDEEHHQRVIEAIVHHTSQENEATKHGGSVVGRVYKNREKEDRPLNLMSDYFVERPHFNTTDFHRRFRMQKDLFYHILNDVVNHEPYFRKKKDGLGRQGLSSVASYDTWIWHAFFEAAGSNNDINILARSPLFNDVVHGVAPHVEYIVNGNQYHLGYYLADGIYPRWAILVKTISSPDNPKNRLFAQMQEAYRKNFERAFGILQARWAIVRGPAHM
ncbi:PREDICTED: uncharacterized protein LOC103328543 [Prunus mume]|uniref:Uncharacterized protein LOC103328543 n=1 Tax=Prunus mume TaxID=102107 RepID=A0ABM0NSH0_PRUMU|nr:PREDICTED: uncharacterized protein LOC103328543 [Prunus mume]